MFRFVPFFIIYDFYFFISQVSMSVRFWVGVLKQKRVSIAGVIVRKTRDMKHSSQLKISKTITCQE